MFHPSNFLCLLLLLLLGCEKEIEPLLCDDCACIESVPDAYSWPSIYSNEITTLVGQSITLRSKLYWDEGFGGIDSMPDFRFAGPIRLWFENADQFIENEQWHNERRGDMFLLFEDIEKISDPEAKAESYLLDGKALSKKEAYYHIQGRIRYRDWLNLDPETLNNPAFIKQSNNVVYWAQTFEFVAERVCAGE